MTDNMIIIKVVRRHEPSIHKIQLIYRLNNDPRLITISLVRLTDKYYENNPWEIYQLTGESLFDDVERYPTLQDAEDKIHEYLMK